MERYYIFEKTGHFIQKHNKEIDGEGSYLVNSKRSIITLKGKRNGFAFNEEVLFQFKGDDLLLISSENGGLLKLSFEKPK